MGFLMPSSSLPLILYNGLEGRITLRSKIKGEINPIPNQNNLEKFSLTAGANRINQENVENNPSNILAK